MARQRSRRGAKVVGALLVLAAVLALALAIMACGGTESSDEGSDTGGAPVPGGTLKVGMQPGNGQYDPVMMAGSVGDIILICQAQENLVALAQDFSVKPWLAKDWDSPDGKSWTFNLQEGVTFSNGEPFTSEDVLYSFERLRSKESPMAGVYANIKDVVADSPTQVTFHLKAVDSEFPSSLTDYRAKMLCKSVKDPMTELVGTGPFVLESYAAEDRAVLKKNLSYWQKDADGNALPYLDGVEFIYSPDTAGQIEGLQGGALNWVGGLTAEQKQTIEANPSLKVITTKTNYMNALQIRVDQGAGKDKAVRQALWAGTDRQAIVDLVAPGVGVAGNGTFVGPAYEAYYTDEQPPYDPEKAKQLLAEAGYADGLKIKLVCQNADPMPAIATAWQAQMKEIGVDVEIQQVPTDVYYADKGTDTWYEADFGMVDWGTRAVPVTYFQLALTSDAAWNYARWKNAEFDSIVKQIPLTLDEAERADLYKQAQAIIQDEVPMMNFIVLTAVAGESANVDGIELDPDWAHTTFTTAYFTE
ncbi:MAG: ABC transporter substrate-binding protein [Actinobacteria bacterium]|nr:ABC transporter substrate-binding protein [Actinomycetota bacterium]